MYFIIDIFVKVPFINGSILLLFGVLGFLTYTQLGLIHIFIMATLAIGLLLSVNWYLQNVLFYILYHK
jgi:hypothetical protein